MKLNPEQEESLKKQRRLLRNRESAAMSRAKRRDLLSTLEARSQDLITKLKKLDSQIDEMKKSNQDLRAKVAVAKKTRPGTAKKSAPGKTPLAPAGNIAPRSSIGGAHPEIRSIAPLSAPATLRTGPIMPVKQEPHPHLHFAEQYPYHSHQQIPSRVQRYGQAYYAPRVQEQLSEPQVPTVAGGSASASMPPYVPPIPLHHPYAQESPSGRWGPGPSRPLHSYPQDMYGVPPNVHFQGGTSRGPAPPY
jgi:hypothetical protein